VCLGIHGGTLLHTWISLYQVLGSAWVSQFGLFHKTSCQHSASGLIWLCYETENGFFKRIGHPPLYYDPDIGLTRCPPHSSTVADATYSAHVLLCILISTLLVVFAILMIQAHHHLWNASPLAHSRVYLRAPLVRSAQVSTCAAAWVATPPLVHRFRLLCSLHLPSSFPHNHHILLPTAAVSITTTPTTSTLLLLWLPPLSGNLFLHPCPLCWI